MGGRNARTEEVLRQVVAPIVEAHDADLEDIEVRQVGRRDVVRAIVDADGGVDLDRVAEISRAISLALDDSAAVAQALGERGYVLEVGSPGVERPLTLPRHWRRAAGRLVTAYLIDGTTVVGRLMAVDETAGTILLGDRTIPLSELDHGSVQVEFTAVGGE